MHRKLCSCSVLRCLQWITLHLWPPNSPALSPSVDCCVWSSKQEKVYQTHITNTDKLKQHLEHERTQLGHVYIADDWWQQRHLCASMKSLDAHLEHRLHCWVNSSVDLLLYQLTESGFSLKTLESTNCGLVSIKTV